MKRQFSACQTRCSMYTHLSSTLFQLFEPQVQKNRRFHVPQPTFLFPLEYVAWLERQFNACQTPRSMYLSVFNSFRVIRCLSQCVNLKIAIFTTFLFPLERPWGNHAKCCMDGKRIRCLQIFSQHIPISSIVSPMLKSMRKSKNRYFTTFLFPLETPLGQSR